MKYIDYSVVIPIFNESEIIPELWRRLSDILDKLDSSSEVIFINDGSVDNSLELLKEINHKNQKVKIISFSRNFGHQCALSAGIDHANGKAVILMDGDLQDSPEAIISFLRLWQQGYDVVYAIRKNRKEKWLKRLAFKSFYYIQRKLSGIVTPMDAGIFSLMDRKVILTLRQMPERNKYLSG
ncbi:MAG: glycosyltransferase family 2 protein, partial [Trichodesmium sp. St5_bin8]|nr:glycosyltransferase family 2 protein [Trichodesmium sp. St5_bin8]